MLDAQMISIRPQFRLDRADSDKCSSSFHGICISFESLRVNWLFFVLVAIFLRNTAFSHPLRVVITLTFDPLNLLVSFYCPIFALLFLSACLAFSKLLGQHRLRPANMRDRLVILPRAAAGQGTNLANMGTSAAIFSQPVAGGDLSIANVTNSTALLTQPASGYPTSLPTMDASPAILSQPALGQDVQLGMLYDLRTAQFFGGVSLWDNEIVNARQTLEEHTLQNGEFTYSTSLEEARNQAALDIEGALGLDLGMFKAAGSARYLNDNKASTFEARVDVSCTIIRRTRRIPQEILASMQHERKLDDPQFTHFVGEVVKGGNAPLS